jgi:hypothetical protein
MKKIFGWLSQAPAPNEQDEEQDEEEESFINCEQLLPPMSGSLTERKEEPTPPSSPLLYNSQEVLPPPPTTDLFFLIFAHPMHTGRAQDASDALRQWCPLWRQSHAGTCRPTTHTSLCNQTLITRVVSCHPQVRPTDTLLEFLLNASKKLGTDAKRVFTKYVRHCHTREAQN